jgi:hypothetical protein
MKTAHHPGLESKIGDFNKDTNPKELSIHFDVEDQWLWYQLIMVCYANYKEN